MIKMFASDLDGTLLNALHEADGTIRRAIRELTEAGLHVVPATGRSTLPIGEHGFTGLALDACCSNGSIVRNSHGEVLKTWTIDPQVTEELLKAFPDICFDCSTPDGMFSSGSFEMHQAGFKKDSPIKRIVMRGMRARGGCSYSFVNWEMLSVRPNRGMLTPGHSAGGLQSARCVSARLRKAPCLA